MRKFAHCARRLMVWKLPPSYATRNPQKNRSNPVYLIKILPLICYNLSGSLGNRSHAKRGIGGGTSELHRAVRRPKGRDGGAILPRRTESATEKKPPARVRVKWCGKSAPRMRQRMRQGKPRTEQDQTGSYAARVRQPSRSLRVMVTTAFLRRQNSGYWLPHTNTYALHTMCGALFLTMCSA